MLKSSPFVWLVAACLLFTGGRLKAQAAQPADTLSQWALHGAVLSLPEFREALALANDAHDAAQVESNLVWTEAAFAKRGFATERLATAGPPLLLASLAGPADADTVMLYFHVDGQPVDPKFWRQPDPYAAELTERVNGADEARDWSALRQTWEPEWRIYARSAADAKGPVLMFLTTLDELVRHRQAPAYPLKVILDFEEEIGSPNLAAAVATHRAALGASHLLIFDGPAHPSNRPTLTFGARGMATARVEVYGPATAQHSGHYGGYVPNPAWDLIRLLAPLRDAAGRITLPGWNDGIAIDAEGRAAMDGVPDDAEELRRRLQLGRVDSVGASLQEALAYPTLNVRGLGSGWIDEERRTIIPATAVAELDIRTVVESDPARLLGLLRAYLGERGYFVVEGREPTEAERVSHPRTLRFDGETSYGAFRTPLDSPTGRWLTRAVTAAHGTEPVRIRTMGGSIPISPFINTLRVPAVVVPTVNSDNNQHAPDENLRLGSYTDGIQTMLGLLSVGP